MRTKKRDETVYLIPFLILTFRFTLSRSLILFQCVLSQLKQLHIIEQRFPAQPNKILLDSPAAIDHDRLACDE